MTTFEIFLENLVNFDPWFIVKLAFLIFLAVYLAFAVIVIRQVQLMVKTLNGSFDLPLQILSFVHMAFAAFVFLMAMAIL